MLCQALYQSMVEEEWTELQFKGQWPELSLVRAGALFLEMECSIFTVGSFCGFASLQFIVDVDSGACLLSKVIRASPFCHLTVSWSPV